MKGSQVLKKRKGEGILLMIWAKVSFLPACVCTGSLCHIVFSQFFVQLTYYMEMKS